MIILDLLASLSGSAWSAAVAPELLAVREAEQAFLAQCNAFEEAVHQGETTALVHGETAALLTLGVATSRARQAGYVVRWSPETMREIGRRSLLPTLTGLRTCEGGGGRAGTL